MSWNFAAVCTCQWIDGVNKLRIEWEIKIFICVCESQNNNNSASFSRDSVVAVGFNFVSTVVVIRLVHFNFQLLDNLPLSTSQSARCHVDPRFPESSVTTARPALTTTTATTTTTLIWSKDVTWRPTKEKKGNCRWPEPCHGKSPISK